MADFDVLKDTQPQMENQNSVHYGRKSISELKTIVQGKDSGTYTDAYVRQMTYNDLVNAAKITPQIDELPGD